VAEQTLANRIVVAKEVAHGQPRIAGTRIMVHTILELLAANKSIAEITSDEYFPDITAEDVLACLAYASHAVQHLPFPNKHLPLE
jgi:uncharacterized protein (DUF433 family)